MADPATCVHCGGPAHTVIVLRADDHEVMHVGTCRPDLGAVLLDLADWIDLDDVPRWMEP